MVVKVQKRFLMGQIIHVRNTGTEYPFITAITSLQQGKVPLEWHRNLKKLKDSLIAERIVVEDEWFTLLKMYSELDESGELKIDPVKQRSVFKSPEDEKEFGEAYTKLIGEEFDCPTVPAYTMAGREMEWALLDPPYLPDGVALYDAPQPDSLPVTQ